jgi:replicative DNA helicase
MAKRNRNRQGEVNSKALIELTNTIMRRIPGSDRETSLAIQQELDEGIRSLLMKSEIGKEALADFLFQKKPPCNLESEAAFLGKAMLFPQKLMPLATQVNDEYFYDNRHAWIWFALKSLWDDAKRITMDGIFSTLEAVDKLESAGGKRYINAVVKDQGTEAGFEDRLAEITQYYTLRGIWATCAEAVHDVMSVEPDEATDFRLTLIEKLGSFAKFQKKSHSDGSDLSAKLGEYVQKLQDAMERGDTLTGGISPIVELDRVTNGWQDSDLIVVAGRPGMGKTALAISDACEAVLNGIPVLFFSMEMSAVQLAARMFCIIKGYSLKVAVEYKINELHQFLAEELPNLPIYIDDTANLNWKQAFDKATLLKEKHGIRRIYFDYVQLMGSVDPRITNTEQIVSENSRGLKIIAKTLNCPVFELSQLSRSCESRADKRPLLSDLRHSGAIEQDADIVIFTYRDEYYGIMENDERSNTQGVAELIIAKHRNGALGTVQCFFNAPITKFTNLDRRPTTYTSGITHKKVVDVEEISSSLSEDIPF